MRTKRRILWAGILLVVVASGWFLFAHSGEPRYEGKSLSAWFKRYCRSGQWMHASDETEHLDANAALLGIGLKGVPYLVDRVFDTNTDSGSRSNLYVLLNDLPHKWGLPAFVTRRVMSQEAADVLTELRPPTPMLLNLLRPYLDSTNVFRHRQALYVLGAAGDGAEQVVPRLVAGLEDPDLWSRRLAMQSLGRLGTNASAAVPALIDLLQSAKDDTNHFAYSTVMTLGNIGSNAAPALPLVTEYFHQLTNWNMQCTIATAAAKIDAGQTWAIDFLMDGLTNHQPMRDRWLLAEQLGNLGQNAKVALPALLAALASSTNQNLWVQAAEALRKTGLPKETYLPVLKKRLASADEYERENCATMVLRIDPADHEAQATMIELVKSSRVLEIQAINALAEAGPAANGAVPALEGALKNGSGQVRDAAARALKKIQGDRVGK